MCLWSMCLWWTVRTMEIARAERWNSKYPTSSITPWKIKHVTLQPTTRTFFISNGRGWQQQMDLPRSWPSKWFSCIYCFFKSNGRLFEWACSFNKSIGAGGLRGGSSKGINYSLFFKQVFMCCTHFLVLNFNPQILSRKLIVVSSDLLKWLV